MEKGRNAFKMLTGKPTEKRPLRRPRRSWEDNIIIYRKETGVHTRECVNLAEGRDYCRVLGNAALNLQVSYKIYHSLSN